MFDVIFISYDEPNAEHHYRKVRDKVPPARLSRVHGVKGIHRAHRLAAQFSSTEMMWVVDGDAELVPEFNFELPPTVDSNSMYVWRSKNPVNGLIYGYGGVKLLPTEKVRQMRIDTIDMTTSLDCWYRVVNVVSNVTQFNSSPFNAWKGAFREVVKLGSSCIKNADPASEQRLDTWLNVFNQVPHVQWVKQGVEDGMMFVNSQQLPIGVINDPDYLKQQFARILC